MRGHILAAPVLHYSPRRSFGLSRDTRQPEKLAAAAARHFNGRRHLVEGSGFQKLSFVPPVVVVVVVFPESVIFPISIFLLLTLDSIGKSSWNSHRPKPMRCTDKARLKNIGLRTAWSRIEPRRFHGLSAVTDPSLLFHPNEPSR